MVTGRVGQFCAATGADTATTATAAAIILMLGMACSLLRQPSRAARARSSLLRPPLQGEGRRPAGAAGWVSAASADLAERRPHPARYARHPPLQGRVKGSHSSSITTRPSSTMVL